MTDSELDSALSVLESVTTPLAQRERAEVIAAIVAELQRRDPPHFDRLEVRYSVGKDGTIKRGLPW